MDDLQAQQRGQDWLKSFFQLAGFPETVESETAQSEADGSCWLTISTDSLTPEDIESLIGADGSVLDAMQYLLNTSLNVGHPRDEQRAYTLELDGYRVKRQAELREMAEVAVQHVRDHGGEYEMPALSAAERRQVHTFLKTFEGLETFSRGQEPDRRLVVQLADEAMEEVDESGSEEDEH
jgi:spoIIIJ-associated protein